MDKDLGMDRPIARRDFLHGAAIGVGGVLLGGLSPELASAAAELAEQTAPGQRKQLDLAFAPGSFRSGERLAFGVDRDEADQAGTLNGAAGGNSADLLGPSVRIPEGTIASSAAEFFGTFQGGVQFRGRFFNPIGRLQAARRLRLRQCRGGRELGPEEKHK